MSFEKDIQAGNMWDHEGHPMRKTAVRWVIKNLASEWVCSQPGPKSIWIAEVVAHTVRV